MLAHQNVSMLSWNFHPIIIASLIAVSWLYLHGVRTISRRAAGGGGDRAADSARRVGVGRWQVGCFLSGVAVLAIALLSPIDALADELASVHMVQHKLIMMIAAPLMVLGSPGLVGWWAMPGRWRDGLLRWRGRVGWWPRYVLWQPAVLFVLYAAMLWIWHLPRFYEAALHHGWIHDVQHVALFGTACLFWRVLIDPLAARRLGMMTGMLYLFTTCLHASVLGVFMALAPAVWYPSYIDTAPAWNLSALQDQQLAGLIMWMPGCIVYALAAAVIFALWLKRMEQRGAQPPSLAPGQAL